jgi:hypothetical protein
MLINTKEYVEQRTKERKGTEKERGERKRKKERKRERKGRTSVGSSEAYILRCRSR